MMWPWPLLLRQHLSMSRFKIAGWFLEGFRVKSVHGHTPWTRAGAPITSTLTFNWYHSELLTMLAEDVAVINSNYKYKITSGPLRKNWPCEWRPGSRDGECPASGKFPPTAANPSAVLGPFNSTNRRGRGRDNFLSVINTNSRHISIFGAGRILILFRILLSFYSFSIKCSFAEGRGNAFFRADSLEQYAREF